MVHQFYAFLLVSFSFVSVLSAQTDTSASPSFSGYLETYYQRDLTNLSVDVRPNFLYNHKRNNEFAVNLAFLKGAYSHVRTRANFALMVGNYAEYNLSAESDVAQHIYEANVGVRLSPKHQFWLDAGIMPSHIGFESAIGADCPTATRSLVAENSPYYESGARVSYKTKNEKWYLAALLLNGWQRIQKANGDQVPSVGVQLTFTPNALWTFNYSNYYGADGPKNAVTAQRLYHNTYLIYKPSGRWSAIAGFDLGSEIRGSNTSHWFTPVGIVRYQIKPNLILSARGEYFSDKNAALIDNGGRDHFQVLGYSANLDYSPFQNTLFRVECRRISNAESLSTAAGFGGSSSLLASMSVRF
jgi:Putative beta-barrel porin-2, OmpL-like. bbp2